MAHAVLADIGFAMLTPCMVGLHTHHVRFRQKIWARRHRLEMVAR
jgi:hypothetical protein